ncbi:MAG: adenosylcobinamide-GDP ribazoletransferase [Brevinematales bacterium]
MRAFLAALSLLTVFPLKVKEIPPAGRVVVLFPLVGALYGGCVVGWVILGSFLNIPQSVITFGMIVLPLFMNGFFHFDGWCDTWDGFLPLASQKKRLEIMKDSRVGVFGLAMGVMLLLFRYSLYPLVIPHLLGIEFSWILSRSAMVWMAYKASYPREKGTASFLVGQVPPWAFWGVGLQVLMVTLGLTWISGSVKFFLSLAICCVVTWGMRRLSFWKIGGITGDVIGAVAEMGEVLSLLVWMDGL